MKYRLERCPTCQLQPIAEYDLPLDFPSHARARVSCAHCGTKLVAVLAGEAGGGVRQIVFQISREQREDG
ncbi:MAG: hypothetical protein V1774_12180 [Candidatus Eisenbacteria bacterium]